MTEPVNREFVNALFSVIESGRVVMPDAVIAEIVDFQATHPESDDVPTWYLGRLPWRGMFIPLISLEALNNDSFFRQGRSLKIIVIHGVYNRKTLPYWSYVALETPRMQRLPQDALQVDEQAVLGMVERMHAQFGGEDVIVPDIAKIEHEIMTLSV